MKVFCEEMRMVVLNYIASFSGSVNLIHADKILRHDHVLLYIMWIMDDWHCFVVL